ncbi:P27 family phage terminase small subunit [uncultured Sphingomonas sp.]|uniref:P27 family phage terminase small subunit n=1 Tax=uncultured Sphingomonas sp. TaxID=158754 RepID=UPI003747E78A
MARPRKDPAVKKLRGTLRKDREPKALAPIDTGGIAGPMVAPVPLTPRALEHFDVIAGMLAREGRASQQFAYTVAILAQRIDQAEQLQATIVDEGRTYETTSDNGTMYRARPEVAMLSDALRHQQALLSELMLSPTAAQRIARTDTPKGNAFAGL